MTALTHALCLRAQVKAKEATEAVRPRWQQRYSSSKPPEGWVEPARRSYCDLVDGKTYLETDEAYLYVSKFYKKPAAKGGVAA